VLQRRVYNEAVNKKLQETTILRDLDPYIDPDKCAIDVGAATGHITNYLAPRCKHVFAFEAVEPVYRQLRKMEGRHGNVTALNAAVGDFDGMATIYVDDKRLSNSGFQDLVGGPETQVMAVTLDGIMYDALPVGFIKVDVEGTELDVLMGAAGIIANERPNLMVEIYKPYTAQPLPEIFQYLMDGFGYRCYYYEHPAGLIECRTVQDGVKAVEELHHIHDGDFLFAHD
jgi:FkbM family methyltransferase